MKRRVLDVALYRAVWGVDSYSARVGADVGYSVTVCKQ